VDLVGKAGRCPIPAWVKTAVDAWLESVPIVSGKLFRSIRKNGTVCYWWFAWSGLSDHTHGTRRQVMWV
jgi:hypothetical protein